VVKGSVLIVEDDADSRELLAELLMNAGYHSIMADGVASALRRLEHVKPDLVITDFAMPGASGAELIAKMSSTPGLSTIPVLLVTASDATSVDADLRRLGAKPAHVLRKPVDLRALLRVIEASIGTEDR
jgi:CheY-like chemotaxis protein